MKRIILPLLLGLGLALTSCYVTSVSPFYTEKDLVFEPTLVGAWIEVEKEASKESLVVEATGPKNYRVRHQKSEGDEEWDMRLFKIKDHMFLDLVLIKHKEPETIPAHHLARVLQIEPTLKTSSLSHSWLKGLLEKNPKAIRHIKIPNDSDPKNYRIVLTAETQELQQFIMAHLGTEGAFEKPDEMKKVTSK